VKDIRPGSGSSAPEDLTLSAGTLFFSAKDGVHGLALWKSDGTEQGTVLVKDINRYSDSFANYITSITDVAGTVFFRANDGGGNQLWKSDGTEPGTVLVMGIGSCHFDATLNRTECPGNPSRLTNVSGTLFFVGADEELWKSDGTWPGTVLVKDINTGGISGPFELTDVNGTLFFTANDGTHGNELWQSDGTSRGTVMVKDINSTAGSSPFNLVNANRTLFFGANDGVTGVELWTATST